MSNNRHADYLRTAQEWCAAGDFLICLDQDDIDALLARVGVARPKKSPAPARAQG
jgi:hypothetical protein